MKYCTYCSMMSNVTAGNTGLNVKLLLDMLYKETN